MIGEVQTIAEKDIDKDTYYAIISMISTNTTKEHFVVSWWKNKVYLGKDVVKAYKQCMEKTNNNNYSLYKITRMRELGHPQP